MKKEIGKPLSWNPDNGKEPKITNVLTYQALLSDGSTIRIYGSNILQAIMYCEIPVINIKQVYQV